MKYEQTEGDRVEEARRANARIAYVSAHPLTTGDGVKTHVLLERCVGD
ncbi:MAG: hypothetical protein WBZ42_07395 [Halobacteriota archaeon]